MSKIIPEGQDLPAKSSPLTVDDVKFAAMVAQAKSLLTAPMEEGELLSALEAHYIAENNEHYTSAQLKKVIKQVAKDLKPEPVVEEGP